MSRLTDEKRREKYLNSTKVFKKVYQYERISALFLKNNLFTYHFHAYLATGFRLRIRRLILQSVADEDSYKIYDEHDLFFATEGDLACFLENATEHFIDNHC